MGENNINSKASLIWSIADKLTGVYKPHEYGEIILPLTLLKRFDCILADTKEKVLKTVNEHPKITPPIDQLLKSVSGYPIYNISKFDFKTLLDDPDNIESNFRKYISGFSIEAKEIIEKFKFDAHISTMANKDILYQVISEFNSSKAELHPSNVSDIEMGYIFEEIVRRFSESHNEDAGQHYTPREVINLMVELIFENENFQDGYKVIEIYDGACGTGGMLSVSYEYMQKFNKTNKVILHGQELNDQTYAICKADMLLKGQQARIKDGNTLSNDQFQNDKFDYIIMNPPFGREWKNEKNKVEAEYKRGKNGRFASGLPAISDSQLLFLQNAVSKMKDSGSKVAIIHNGSALFSGDAGSGASEIRRNIIENDLLDAIIQLPNDIFYNTGIATYIWILSNKKPEERKGKVQLIDASSYFTKRRKSLGNKRNDISNEQRNEIVKMYSNFKKSKHSKIFDNNYFGYRKITFAQPLLDKTEKVQKLKNKSLKGKMKIANATIDTENIPLIEDLEVYMKREVAPFVSDYLILDDKTKIGYEIAFTKYFYEYKEPRSTEEIMKDILNVDKQLNSTLKELFEDE